MNIFRRNRLEKELERAQTTTSESPTDVKNGRIKEEIKKYSKLVLKTYLSTLLVGCGFFEYVNIKYDRINALTHQQEKIEKLNKEVTELQEVLLGKLNKEPRIITSCHENIKYRLLSLPETFKRSPKVFISTFPVLPIKLLNNQYDGESHYSQNVIFVNGGQLASLNYDTDSTPREAYVRHVLAHERGHLYIDRDIGKLEKSIDEGLAEYISVITESAHPPGCYRISYEEDLSKVSKIIYYNVLYNRTKDYPTKKGKLESFAFVMKDIMKYFRDNYARRGK